MYDTRKLRILIDAQLINIDPRVKIDSILRRSDECNDKDISDMWVVISHDEDVGVWEAFIETEALAITAVESDHLNYDDIDEGDLYYRKHTEDELNAKFKSIDDRVK